MTPDFAKAVDPIFKMMIDLEEQIHKNAVPMPDVTRDAFVRRFDESRAILMERPDDWDLAQYALMVWIDELLSSTLEYEGAGWWRNNKLAFEYYNDAETREGFFAKAIVASRRSKKDAIEVFFLCVVLNFKGVYDGAVGLAVPSDFGLPETIPDWLRKVRSNIKMSPAKVYEKRVQTDHDSAPLTGKFQLLNMVMGFVFVSIVMSLMIYVWLQRQSSSRRGKNSGISAVTTHLICELHRNANGRLAESSFGPEA